MSAPDAATGALWQLRAHGSPAVPFAAALIGADVGLLSDALSISLAASDEAATLLDGMELRVRTLTTTVATTPERCVNSVRGPILWSETITARANALGNDDVFVCMATGRSFDTVENRVLVAALDAIARAGRALRGPTGDRVDPVEGERIAEVAAEALRWRRHPRLAGVSGGRLNGRDMARLRGGHRLARLGPVIAIRNRVAEPFVGDDLIGLSDRWTHEYHRFALGVIEQVSARAATPRSIVAPPVQLSLSDGGLWGGSTSWRHPAAGGGTPAGLCHRGIPLLPPESVYADAPWRDAVPKDGVRVSSPDDVDRLLERVGRRTGRSGRPPTDQRSMSSSST